VNITNFCEAGLIDIYQQSIVGKIHAKMVFKEKSIGDASVDVHAVFPLVREAIIAIPGANTIVNNTQKYLLTWLARYAREGGY
jgi:hypothetical protein